jgi:hypothetical protein
MLDIFYPRIPYKALPVYVGILIDSGKINLCVYAMAVKELLVVLQTAVIGSSIGWSM